MAEQDRFDTAPIRTGATRKRLAVIGLGLTVLVIGLAAAWLRQGTRTPGAPVSMVTLALPTQINSAPAIVAFAQGLFQKADVEVVNQSFLLGKDALKSMLEGKADLAVVADVPFMYARMAGKDVAILAGISQARRALAIVAHKGRGINSVKDLGGKSVGLTLGTNFTYFLDAMLQVHGVERDTVSLHDMNVDAAISAFGDKRIDAAVVFQPYLARLQAQMGEQINVFFGEDVYAFRFLLVGKPAYIDSHPQEVQRVLTALLAASESIRTDPVEARQAVGQVVKVDDAIMSKIFDPEDFVVLLDEAMLLALDDQTRWAMKRGLVKNGPVPNYVDAMKFENLKAVRRAAVKFTH